MEMRKLLKTGVLIFVAILLIGCDNAAVEGGLGRSERSAVVRVGVIDIDKVFENYDKSRGIYERLQKEKQELETEGQKMLDEINTLMKEAELLSDEVRKEREQRIREKTSALELFRRQASSALIDKTAAQYETIMADVRNASKAVASREGYAIVLDSAMTLYANDSLNITDEVVAELNGMFKAGQKKE
jgi:outer membrane protein